MGVATTDLGELLSADSAGLVRLVGLFFAALDADAAGDEAHDPELVVLRGVFLFLVDVDGGEAGIEI